MAVSYLLQGTIADPKAEFPFVANSIAKDGTFAVLCVVAAADIHRHAWAVQVVIGAHVLLIGSLLISLLVGNTDDVSGSFQAPFGVGAPGRGDPLSIWLVLAVAVTAALAWCQRTAARARYTLHYLAPHQHRTLMALAEVLVMGKDELVTPEEVAANVDEYLWSFPAEEKKTKLALTALCVYPMLRLRPPFPVMSPERRIDFIERCFLADVAERRLPGFLRRVVQSMLFAAQQLTFIGYYADPPYGRGDRLRPFLRARRRRHPRRARRPPLSPHSGSARRPRWTPSASPRTWWSSGPGPRGRSSPTGWPSADARW